MVTLMTFPVMEKLPETLDDLAKSRLHIDFHYFGNVGYELFQSSRHPTFVAIFGKMRREPDPVACLKKALNPEDKSACILFILTWEELKARNMSDSAGRSPLSFWPYSGVMWPAGVVHSHKAALSQSFQWVINTAMEMGLMDFWEKEDLKEILKNKNSWMKTEKLKGSLDIQNFSEGGSEDVLKLGNLKGPLLILGFGTLLSGAALFAEVLSHRKKMHEKEIPYSFLR